MGREPQYSSDGKWWWTGSEWVPASHAPQPPPPPMESPPAPSPEQASATISPMPAVEPQEFAVPPSEGFAVAATSAPPAPVVKKGHLWRNLGIASGAFVLILIGIAIATSSGNPQPAANTSRTSPRATPPGPTPSPTQDQGHDAVVAYVTAASDIGPVEDAFTAVSQDCGSDLAACRQDLQKVISTINTYESALPVAPPCLTVADRDLRLGLELEKQGAQQAINGIDATDASQINAGTALLEQGTSKVSQAASEVTAASCP